MNKEKLDQAIAQLRDHYNNTDNLLYHYHTPESLKRNLDEIQESIDYLEGLSNNE